MDIRYHNNSLSNNWVSQVANSGKESPCQCRRHKRYGFDSWIGKIPWKRKWPPTPVFLPGKSHGQRNLVSYSPWGRKELDVAEWAEWLTHTHTSNNNWVFPVYQETVVCMPYFMSFFQQPLVCVLFFAPF